MMTWRLALTMLAVTALLVVSVRAAMCNFRQWRTTRHLPRIIASEDALTAHLHRWDWKSAWPDPGHQGAWKLSIVQCRSYSRLAAARAQTLRPVAVVLGVLGGVLIAEWWPEILAAWKVNSAPVDPQDSFAVVSGWDVALGAGTPLLLALVLLGLVGHLETFTLEAQDLMTAYQRAADQQEAAAQAAVGSPDPAPAPTSWLRRVRGALRHLGVSSSPRRGPS